MKPGSSILIRRLQRPTATRPDGERRRVQHAVLLHDLIAGVAAGAAFLAVMRPKRGAKCAAQESSPPDPASLSDERTARASGRAAGSVPNYFQLFSLLLSH